MSFIKSLKENSMKKFLLIALCFTIIGCASNPTPTSVTIQPDGNNMAYATKEFKVQPGQEVTLIMDNIATIEVMKHNIVILNDESKANEVGQKALTAANYIPDHPAVVAATPMADAGAKTQTTFTAPDKKGRYLFICTFPGHYMMMRGYMIVE